MTLLDHLDELRRAGVVSDLDVAFARFTARLADESAEPIADELLLAACLASAAIGEGDVCADLRRLAGHPVPPRPEGVGLELPVAPALERWRSILRASPVVGSPGERRPLVLDDRDRLYLYRYWSYEREIADDLLARARASAELADAARLRDGLQRIFPGLPDAPAAAPDEAPAAAPCAVPNAAPSTPAGLAPGAPPGSAPRCDWQRVAAVTAALRRLCVISGGPGTGKTTTVVRILALLVQQSPAPPRIRLAAPTGKAAARMQEAIRQAKSRLARDVAPEALAAIPETASTIHRLLGPRLGSIHFRHDRHNPLPVDVLVVDEASMVDVALMAKLLRALPAEARLVLLGDKDQLASVETGTVLGDICGDAPGFSEAFRARVSALCDAEIPPADVASSTACEAAVPPASAARVSGAVGPSPLCDSVVLLRHSYRFGATSGIGALAREVNQGRGEQALALLDGGRFADLAWRELQGATELRRSLESAVVDGYREALELARAGAPGESIFAAFARFRVLCAVRQGELGVEQVNGLIADLLGDAGLIDRRGEWYAGRPVMITRNDYRLRLFNGDVGIALAGPDGRLRVHFDAADGRSRVFPPLRLPQHETVFAMTIHKSQGSEFDRVLLLLPPAGSRILGRELLYTGITRARARVDLWGTRQGLLEAMGEPVRRSSGLRDALWGAAG